LRKKFEIDQARRDLIHKATADFNKISWRELQEYCISVGGHFWAEATWKCIAFGVELSKICQGCGKTEQLDFESYFREND
jgi:hypothetical protein